MRVPRAGPEIENGRVRVSPSSPARTFDRFRRVRRPRARVRLGDAPERLGQAQPIPARRKALFSLSISRAITSRWIWFVPS